MTIPPDVPFATLPPVSGNPNYVLKADIGAYAGTDTRVARDMPTRLNDIFNVLDWGADRTGVADATGAIQDTIDAAYTNGGNAGKGSVVFFPAGTYKIGTPPLRLNPPTAAGQRIKLIGAGRDITVLKGTYATGNFPTGANQVTAVGFLLQSNYTGGSIVAPALIQGLTIWNDSTDPSSGVLYYSQTQGTHQRLIDCRLIGNQAVFLCENTFGGYIRNCIAQCNVPPLGADSTAVAVIGKGALAKSIGYAVDQGVMINNIAYGYDYGFGMIGSDASTGNATFVNNCKAIRCNYGFSLGEGSQSTSGQTPSSGGVYLTSNVAERCGVGTLVAPSGSTLISANIVRGDQGPAEAAQIAGMLWSSAGGGTVTVTTVNDHHISAWPGVSIKVNPPGWTPDGTGTQSGITVIVTGAKTFTYGGVGSSPPAFISGTWNYPIYSGILISQGNANTLVGNSPRIQDASYLPPSSVKGPDGGYDFTVSKIGAGPGGQAKCIAMCMSGLNQWYFHDGVAPGGNWEFIQCSGSNFGPYIKYAGLAGVAAEGIERSIVESGLQSSFGGVVGAGTTAVSYKVRYNSTLGWVRIG